jgi:hypothetical protein
MKDEYDLSKAQRGKFHRRDSILTPPVHLDPAVLAFLTARAEARGITLSELVNALLKKGIELIEAAEAPPPTKSLLAVLATLPTLDEEFPEIKELPAKAVND